MRRPFDYAVEISTTGDVQYFVTRLLEADKRLRRAHERSRFKVTAQTGTTSGTIFVTLALNADSWESASRQGDAEFSRLVAEANIRIIDSDSTDRPIDPSSFVESRGFELASA